MPAPFRLISNKDNVLASANFVASNVTPIAAVFEKDSSHEGYGVVALEGAFTGNSDTIIDVKIVDGVGDTTNTVPVFRGVGSGTISGIQLDSVPEQKFTISLSSFGIPTKRASVDFYSAVLQAKESIDPVAGNTIRVHVSTATLTKTPLNMSVPEDITEDASEFDSTSWDYGQHNLSPDGNLVDDTIRISFGDDPQIYRMYSESGVSKKIYKITPNIVREIPKGTPVYEVTGTYTMIVETPIGYVDEVYPSIISIFDFLSAVRETSDTLDVIGTIADDRAPNGMGVIDIPLRTVPYLLPPIANGSDYLTGLDAITIGPTPASETLTVVCSNNDIVGSEKWKVEGTVSNSLPDAESGVPYNSTAIGFTIPQKNVAEVVTGDIHISNVSYASREEGQELPPICLGPAKIGSVGYNSSITATLRRRITGGLCACIDTEPKGFLSLEALGYAPEEEGGSVLSPEYLSRLKLLYAWRKDFIYKNTYKTMREPIYDPPPAATGGTGQIMNPPVRYAYKITYEYPSGSTKHKHEGCETWYSWDYASKTLYCWPEYWLVGASESESEYVWRSGTSLPAFSNTIGFISADSAASHKSEIDAFLGVKEQTWFNDNRFVDSGGDCPGGANFTVGIRNYNDLLVNRTSPTAFVPATPVTPVVSAGSPTDLDVGGSTVDLKFFNDAFKILSKDLETLSIQATSRILWDDLFTEVQNDLAPMLTIPADVTEGMKQLYSDADTETFLQRYEAHIENAYLSVGLFPGKAEPSEGATSANPWKDEGDEYYWEIPGYAPMFTNVIYHSTKFDEHGDSYCTKEFAATILVECSSALKEGDAVTIAFSSTRSQEKTYQLNDQYEINMIQARPLDFFGGIQGDDTLTWKVDSDLTNAFPEYHLQLTNMSEYNALGLSFQILPGGIPFALGDSWSFAAEGGFFSWRQAGSAWSLSTKIENTPVFDGLTLTFKRGASPSFVRGDTYSFNIHQPYSPKAVTKSDDSYWTWNENVVTLMTDLGSSKPIDCVVLSRHTIPSTATVLFETSLNGFGTVTYSEVLTWNEISLISFFPEIQAQQFRITITGASNSKIGWMWAGKPFTTSRSPDKFVLKKRYAVARGSGWNPTSSYLGVGDAGELGWDKFLFASELEGLLDIVEYSKLNNDSPIILVPNVNHPNEAKLLQIEADDISYVDEYTFQSKQSGDRLMSITIPLSTVIL